jgi:hypothetical protein
VAAANLAGASDYSAIVYATPAAPGPLPEGWSATGIGGGADQMPFVYARVSGDRVLECHLVSAQGAAYEK